ncbi:Oidioi.mRNA.OKI2018_I69.PAR.g8786.t1.cds [Oikopleura dioica]|uniref:Oidioi.mRNA.OKI2018_I69.PAR.g8786.t1.cds n=1 Tax=Oikopleura dioica TaxID=34765 RepID=A0ABN7RM28_OIKDI|nr:Oidioi.mRNA.OKI2018_I69.PAR.g8786.t1.cds [Oikopleura dioica]
MSRYGVIWDSYRLFLKVVFCTVFFSLGATLSSLFWVFQEAEIVGTKIKETEDHVRPTVEFEIGLVVLAGFAFVISIFGVIFGCKQSTKMTTLYAWFSIVASLFCFVGLAYCIYIGAQSVIFYETKQFLLHRDLIPWIPATFCFFLSAFLFIILAVISFKQYKLEKDLLKYYGPTTFDGTINDNFTDNQPISTDKIYESLDKRGFDLRSVESFEPREVVDDFEYRTKPRAM